MPTTAVCSFRRSRSACRSACPSLRSHLTPGTGSAPRELPATWPRTSPGARPEVHSCFEVQTTVGVPPRGDLMPEASRLKLVVAIVI
jgi:hypothetical protein